jgi:hypothetical protein
MKIIYELQWKYFAQMDNFNPKARQMKKNRINLRPDGSAGRSHVSLLMQA